MGPSPFMRFGMIARKLCSLVGGSKTPPTRPYATIKMAPFRRLSTLPYWDSLPVNHRIWYSREVDETDLEDPLMFFKRNPIFDSISSNMLLGKKVKENSFWREILNMNPSMLSKVAGTAFRSLGSIALDNHGRGIPLGAAACLENLRISRSSGRCVLLNIKPRAPETERLTLQQRANDWLAIRDLIIRVVELSDGAAEAKYPVDFLHWLDKLAEDNPRLWLIMYHPIFLSMNGKFSYRVAIDQLLKKEPQKGREGVICYVLRMIGDNLGGLLTLAEKHELLNAVMTYSPRRPRGTSKGKTTAVVNPAGQPPSSADAAGATAASVKDVHPASPADPAAAPVCVNDPAAQSTEKKDKKHRKKLARLRVNTGRKVVGISRDPLVHGLQTSCEGFNFVDSTMLKRYDLHQLVYFVMLPYDHTVLQILFDKRLHEALDMEGFFGEDTSTWKKALDQQERDDKELAKKSFANSFSNVQLEDKQRHFRKDHSKQNNLAKKQTHGSVKNPKFNEGNNPKFNEGNNPKFNEGNNPKFSEGNNPKFSEGNNPKFSEGNNPKFSEGNNPKFSEGKNSQLNEGKNSQLSEGKNSKLSEGKISKLSEGKISKVSEGKISKFSEGKNSKLSEGKNPKLSEGKNPKLSEGKVSKFSEGKNPKLSEGKISKFSEGKISKFSEGKNPKLSEGKNLKLSEGKISKFSEGKNSKLSEGKNSKLSEGKTSKFSEGKTHGSPKNTFQRYEKGTRGQQYKYNKGVNGQHYKSEKGAKSQYYKSEKGAKSQHYKSEKGAKSQYFYRNKRGWDNKK